MMHISIYLPDSYLEFSTLLDREDENSASLCYVLQSMKYYEVKILLVFSFYV